MYLASVRAENFRIFGSRPKSDGDVDRSLQLEFGPATNVLVGENDSGKSAIVDAIRLCLLTTATDFYRITQDDFHVDANARADEFTITCSFADLTIGEQATFLELLSTDSVGTTALHITVRAQIMDPLRPQRVSVTTRTGPDGSGPSLDGAARELLKATYLCCEVMSFTALHRAVGAAPGPVTDGLLDAAIASGAAETNDLDWKSELPPAKGLPQADFPKDVAAMANSGGGVIVFGVRESQKVATERVDVGEFDEVHERSLRSAAITAISPPVFGLNVHRLGDEGNRAVVVEIPASVDGPHLIYRNEYFGAPVRNDSDTVWMKERQIEAMYRARFDERRHATEALDNLFAEAAGGRDSRKRAWLIAVAHPRIPRFRDRLTHDETRDVLSEAEGLARIYAGRGGIHPLDNVDRLNPRPGPRRWVAVNTATGESSAWKEAWVSIHHDGSISLAAGIGGHRASSDSYFEGSQVESSAIECAVADLMALIRTTAEVTDNDEYDVRVGIEWIGESPLTILTKDNFGHIYDGASTPLHRYTPVETTVNALESAVDYYWRVHDLARDCVNQGGISNVRMIQPPAREDQE